MKSSKSSTVEKAREARLERERAREQERHANAANSAAPHLQKVVRGFLARRRHRSELQQALEAFVCGVEASTTAPPRPLAIASHVAVLLRLAELGEGAEGRERLVVAMGRIVAHSLTGSNVSLSYAAAAATLGVRFVRQMRRLVAVCLQTLETVSEANAAILLRVLLTLTTSDMWAITRTGAALKGAFRTMSASALATQAEQAIVSFGRFLVGRLSREKPTLDAVSLAAACALVTRALQGSAAMTTREEERLNGAFVVHVLSVPLLMHHMLKSQRQFVEQQWIVGAGLLQRVFGVLVGEQSLRITFNALEGNGALCLLGNLCQLYGTALEMSGDFIAALPTVDDFVTLTQRVLAHCRGYVSKRATNMTSFHVLFGWFSGTTERQLQEALPLVASQIQSLWTPRMLRAVFVDVYTETQDPRTAPADAGFISVPVSSTTSVVSRLFDTLRSTLGGEASGGSEGSAAAATARRRRLGTLDALACMRLQRACLLYITVVNTLPKMRQELLNAIAFADLFLLPRLWHFLVRIGPRGDMRIFLDATGVLEREPLLDILLLFLDTTVHLVTVLDDDEFYVKQTPFRQSDFLGISRFLLHFVFKLVWHERVKPDEVGGHGDGATTALLLSARRLLRVLYDRDTRRAFCPADHWLIRDLRSATSEFDTGTPRSQLVLQWIPQTMSFHQRVALFRRLVERDMRLRVRDQSQSAPVSIRRTAMLEDGFRGLQAASSAFLRGAVRVKFVNEQGLDEAGIDQHGVFKEFLEEVITRAFDPSLGLFRATAVDQHLYPSPMSSIHENHLNLFEFVGKMLGKALYEGIVVEVPFAMFFLSKMLGRQSTLDELPSLDGDLYKQLTFLKKYDGDVRELDLTFCVDESRFGVIETTDLKLGGAHDVVTNENRILYIHLMADYRMNRQFAKQSEAFIRGFTSVVERTWLNFFSAPELQRLISGDARAFDVAELRRNVIYYGGYSDSHRVVRWLFEVLVEFDDKLRSAFLKFVTSCSKPPILGFGHLEPRLGIRCVHPDDNEDDIVNTTPSGIVRALFSSSSRGETRRLPTSSTCFNLLKLPMYNSKKTLREKLIVAITSGAGFELS